MPFYAFCQRTAQFSEIKFDSFRLLIEKVEKDFNFDIFTVCSNSCFICCWCSRLFWWRCFHANIFSVFFDNFRITCKNKKSNEKYNSLFNETRMNLSSVYLQIHHLLFRNVVACEWSAIGVQRIFVVAMNPFPEPDSMTYNWLFWLY